FRHPDASVKNIECPLFFPVDGRWVLIVAQGKPVDWFVGDLDPVALKFTPTARGKADYGQFYAPNVLMNDPDGRKVLWGWLDGVPPKKGWRHCMTLPRVLSIRPDGTLGQRPLPALSALRGEKKSAEDRLLADASTALIRLPGESAELSLILDRNGDDRAELKLGESLAIAWDGRTLEVGDSRVPLASEGPLALRIFVDRSIAEVYAGDVACASRVIARGPADGLEVRGASKGGRASARSIEAWPIGTIWEAP
ncbi:MAG: GH32 C-terminal domain-containing protein, partial [Isosphaeraceae bacterium]